MNFNVRSKWKKFNLLLVVCIVFTLSFNIVYGATAPRILSFNASSTDITLGETVTLSWRVLNAAEVEIIGLEKTQEHFDILQGKLEVWPMATTTYVLIAYSEDGLVSSKTITVNVDEETTSESPRINYFWGGPRLIKQGGTGYLFWNTRKARRVEIIGLEKVSEEELPTTGGIEVWPFSTTTYVLNVYGYDGTMVSRSVTINVEEVVPEIPYPEIVSFTTDKENIELGDTVSLSWKTENTKSVEIKGLEKMNEGELPLSGTLEVWPMATTEYTLTAYGEDGLLVSKTLTIKIKKLPELPIMEYEAVYTMNDWGSGATVNVEIKNSGTVNINDWKLSWTYGGNQIITNMWNADYKQSGQKIEIYAKKWNANISPGSNIRIGFNIQYSGINEIPADLSLISL